MVLNGCNKHFYGSKPHALNFSECLKHGVNVITGRLIDYNTLVAREEEYTSKNRLKLIFKRVKTVWAP